MSQEKEREAFEAWWYDTYHAGHIHADSHGVYHAIEVQAAWEAWRDRAALATQPPAVQGEPVAWRTFDGEGGYDYRAYEGNEDYRDKFIARNGVKYAGWVEALYTSPPSREVEPLTDEQLWRMRDWLWEKRAVSLSVGTFKEMIAHGIRSRGEGEKHDGS